jgi:O-antigen/teichoic acid export membrane protein
MHNIKSTLVNFAKNKVIVYIFTRYLTYFIQFINSLIIAINLGPFYLGIWGFINLIIQYFAQINLGIPYYINATVSINIKKEIYINRVVQTAMLLLIILSTIFILFFIFNDLIGLQLGNKYQFSKFSAFICLIVVVATFDSLLSNIFRIYGKLFEIAFYQSAFPFLTLIIVFFFKGDNLLWGLVIANVFAVTLSLILFLFGSPIKLKPIFDWSMIKQIQISGWHLFIYNASFYLIAISTRSFISGYYSVSEFGYFTFSFSLANTIFLLFEAFSYLIFPKMINRFASMTNVQVSSILTNIRDIYVTFSHGLVHFAILLFPVFVHFIPKYQSATVAFKFIALTVVLFTNAFGYQNFLIAKGKEKLLGLISLSALIINILLNFILVKIFQVPYYLVIGSTMGTYFIYILVIGYFGRSELNISKKLIHIINDVFPFHLFIPFVLSIFFILFSLSDIFFVIPLIIYLILNFNACLNAKDFIKRIIASPEVINI